ncbi:MAG: hypothetical protein ACPGUH_07910 [Winogradskyella sp.]
MNKTKLIALTVVLLGIFIKYILKNEYDLISGLLVGFGVGLACNTKKSKLNTKSGPMKSNFFQ